MCSKQMNKKIITPHGKEGIHLPKQTIFYENMFFGKATSRIKSHTSDTTYAIFFVILCLENRGNDAGKLQRKIKTEKMGYFGRFQK